jgi:hypothetical protein
VGHTLKSSSLLLLEASRARIFQFGLKAGKVMMMDDARGIIAKVSLSGR